jgi:hypothetical protein
VHAASGQTTWERPAADSSADASSSSAAASSPSASNEAVVAEWRKLIDAARRDANARITEKNAKFSGLRKFADVAAKRKAESAKKKAEDAAAEAAMDAAASAGGVAVKKPILAFLDIENPPVEKKDIEEYAETYFELNRKGMFGAKSTVAKMLSWKNVSGGEVFSGTSTSCHAMRLSFMGCSSADVWGASLFPPVTVREG